MSDASHIQHLAQAFAQLGLARRVDERLAVLVGDEEHVLDALAEGGDLGADNASAVP